MKLLSLFLILLFNLVVFSQTANDTLDKIKQRSIETNSDAVLIIQNGKTLLDYKGKEKGLIELMSCTKSLSALAIVKLIQEGKIRSLDQPLHEYFPEWKQGEKQHITIRHILDHTSGLQNDSNSTEELYQAKNLVKFALDAPLIETPGKVFRYNNKAVNLVAEIVKIASGKRLDLYMEEKFFSPMQLNDYKWRLDKDGNPFVFANLQMTAEDFIKFGELFLEDGIWNGKILIGKDSLAKLLEPSKHSPHCGLLWWLIFNKQTFTIDDEKFTELKTAQVDQEFLEKLTPLINKTFNSQKEYGDAMREIFGQNWNAIIDRQLSGKSVTFVNQKGIDPIGFNANGTCGQFLYVFPKTKLIAVRQIHWKNCKNQTTDGFWDFGSLLQQLNTTN